MKLLGNTCTACGVERRKRSHIRYHSETFQPYCSNPYVCNNDHPNSVRNLLRNQQETVLYTLEEAKAKFEKYLDTVAMKPGQTDKLKRIMSGPTTIRFNNLEMAKFVLQLQEELELPSLSDTIRYCIAQMMEAKGYYVQTYAKEKEKRDEQEKLDQAIAYVSSPKEPDTPEDMQPEDANTKQPDIVGFEL